MRLYQACVFAKYVYAAQQLAEALTKAEQGYTG